MFWVMFLTVVFTRLLFYRWQKRGLYKLAQNLKTDFKPLPVVGHLAMVTEVKTNEDFMTKIKDLGMQANKHGGLTYVWAGPVFAIIVTDPQIVEKISKKCLDKNYLLKFLDMFMGNGSLIAPVNIWRYRRKAINRMYRQQNLNNFPSIFSRLSSILMDKLCEVDGKDAFSVWNYMNPYALDAFAEGILGIQLNAQYKPDQPFLKAIDDCSKLATARIYKPWQQLSAIYRLLPEHKAYKDSSKVLNDFMDQVIKIKRKAMQNANMHNMQRIHGHDTNGILETHKENRKPLLDYLLESSGTYTISDEACREEMAVLTIAATDTTSGVLSFIAVLMSRHPEVQEKAYQELLEVFGDSEEPIEDTDLTRLKYLEAVIKETLRLYPPVPGVVRNVNEDVQISPDITLVKGIAAAFNFWAMHRNPKYWGDDAEMFRPERFLHEPLKHPEAFMPFSVGPRNCPGYKFALMSIKITAAKLLRRYQLLPATGDGNLPLRLQFDITIKDVDGFQIKIKSRGKYFYSVFILLLRYIFKRSKIV